MVRELDALLGQFIDTEQLGPEEFGAAAFVPIVVNIRELGPRSTWPTDIVRVDRMTEWGNPYPIGRGVSRFDSLAACEGWLARRLVQEPTFLEPLRWKRLACWCRPPGGFLGHVLCHAQLFAAELYGIDADLVA